MPRTPLCINWTITPRCNYHCKYCFARFPELAHQFTLPIKDQLKIPSILFDAGCEKLTFVGGEPLLSPSLPALLDESRQVGLTTMIVTNGSLLSGSFLRENGRNIDWISLSIDSQYENTQYLLGRGNGSHVAQTVAHVGHVRDAGIRLKLNSVVTKHNVHESMDSFIERLQPDRWKVFQMLPVKGQNDQFVGELAISADEFARFVETHREVTCAVFEDNSAMTGSYLMLSPDGRFFSNSTGTHSYTDSILDVGVNSAFHQNMWCFDKFQARGGIYTWGSNQDNIIETSIQEVIP